MIEARAVGMAGSSGCACLCRELIVDKGLNAGAAHVSE